MLKRFTWPLVLAIAVSAEAGAEPRVSIGGGTTLPLSAYGDEDRAGFHVGAALTLPIGAKGVRARLDGRFSRTARDHGEATRIVGGALGLSYHLGGKGSVSPYFMAGAGVHEIGFFGGDTLPVYPGRTRWMHHETKPSLEGGAGIEGNLGRVALFGEARVVAVNTEYTVFHRARTTFVLLTVGVRLGGKKK